MKFLSNITAGIVDAYTYRHEPERQRILAQGYWSILLCLAALVAVASILYGAYQLFSVFQEGNPEEAPFTSGKETKLDTALLQTTLDGFAARAANYSALKSNPPSVSDPAR